MNVHQQEVWSGKQLKIGKIVRLRGLRWRVISQDAKRHGSYPTIIECLDYRELREDTAHTDHR